MAISRRSIAALHVRQVTRNEKKVAKALAGFFREQVAAVLEELDSSGVASVDQAFQGRDWQQRLKEIMFPALGRLVVTGTVAEFALHDMKLPRASKAIADVAAIFGISTQPPAWLLEATSNELDRIFSQSYWQEVAVGTRSGIQEIVDFGKSNGASIREIRQQIEEEFGDTYSRTRANAVARTEVSACMNAGHAFGAKQIAADSGLVVGLEWLSVMGSTTRPDHADCDGQQIPIDGRFIVGGERARYPGDAELSAAQRVHCQCTCVSTGLSDREEE